MRARKMSFAGSWYPGDAASCRREIEEFIEEARSWPVPERPYIGGIVPHAGWFYSGAIACNVIRHLAAGPVPEVLFIFGRHLPAGAPNFIMSAGGWETPFGALPIHSEIARALSDVFPFRIETATQFTPDNTIELQLPFVKYFFRDIAIVPMGLPPERGSLDIGRRAVGIMAELGLTAKVLGSTDLTHYGANYGFMPRGIGPAAVDWVKNENDRLVIAAMDRMDPEAVLETAFEHRNACCAGAAATAIAAVQALGGGPAELLTYATSHDKTPGDSLVGYVGMLF